MRLTDTQLDMLFIISQHYGITAGKAGFRLWYKKGNECRNENTCATMHCRAAGKMLKQMEDIGLVRHQQYGPTKLWYITDHGREMLSRGGE